MNPLYSRGSILHGLEFEAVEKTHVMAVLRLVGVNPLYFTLLLLAVSCKTSGPGIFKKKSPHEQYGDRLTNAGLTSTALGNLWFRMAEQSIAAPTAIKIPYKETGYFSAERPAAAGLRFDAVRGQQLTIKVEKNPAINFNLYIDLWRAAQDNQLKHLAAADTLNYSIRHEVSENASYILRIQPELLTSGEYTISITAGPSLAYPIKASGKNHIQSFWGADRDGGARKHEGIDLFAPFRTPIVAAADGTVTRVHETAIGGKVVWLRPENRNYTLYYAHLDSQLVTDGQKVKTGDTLGLMGKTGNARFTSPHLHFGIYTFGGAVDPLPFVNPVQGEPEKITASTKLLGKLVRTGPVKASVYPQPNTSATPTTEIAGNTVMQVEAATSTWFRVRLPNGQPGYIRNAQVHEADKPIRNHTVKTSLQVLDQPDSLAAKKTSIPAGETVDILGNYNNFYFISKGSSLTGWIMK
jgi:murein DD-endopeptidase MepM/ murein hydrolase activator NlpD